MTLAGNLGRASFQESRCANQVTTLTHLSLFSYLKFITGLVLTAVMVFNKSTSCSVDNTILQLIFFQPSCCLCVSLHYRRVSTLTFYRTIVQTSQIAELHYSNNLRCSVQVKKKYFHKSEESYRGYGHGRDTITPVRNTQKKQTIYSRFIVKV